MRQSVVSCGSFVLAAVLSVFVSIPTAQAGGSTPEQCAQAADALIDQGGPQGQVVGGFLGFLALCDRGLTAINPIEPTESPSGGGCDPATQSCPCDPDQSC